MRLLYVLPYFPSRIRVRPYQLIRELSRRHDVTVLAAGSDADKADSAELVECCQEISLVPVSIPDSLQSCLYGAIRGHPLQATVCTSPALRREMTRLLRSRSFDMVHVEHIRA